MILDGIQFEELSITQQQSGEQTLEDVVVMKCDSNSINGPNNRSEIINTIFQMQSTKRILVCI